jgi:redox-sensitive bicupin YhaK (pirin superfamily)
MPRKLSLVPSYQQIKVDLADRTDRLCQIACPALEDGTVPTELQNQAVGVNQDVNIYASILPKGSQVALSHFIRGTRAAWIQVATGGIQLKIQDQIVSLNAGDGVGIDTPTEICISRSSENPDDAEFLLFDLA